MLIRAVEDLNPELLTQMLHRDGCLPLERSVVNIVSKPMDTGGEAAQSFRITVTYDGNPGAATDAPSSMVGKFSHSGAGERGAVVGGYSAGQVEVLFYRDLAPNVDADLARCYYGDADDKTGEFALLLEDLTPARPGNQLLGCSPDEAAESLTELARIQAVYWGHPILKELGWLNRGKDSESQAANLQMHRHFFGHVVERFGPDLTADELRQGELLAEYETQWEQFEPGPTTLQHGDFRLDNLMFGSGPDGTRVHVIDWQTVWNRPGAIDAAYLILTSFTVEDRRKYERDLVSHYHSALDVFGVKDWPFDDCWMQYQVGGIYGYVIPVWSAPNIPQSDRGDQLYMQMLTRSAAHMADHDSIDLLLTKT